MVELFRYIEQELVLPLKDDSSIDVEETDSEFQDKIRSYKVQSNGSTEKIKKEAGEFVDKIRSQSPQLLSLKQPLLDLHQKLIFLEIDHDSDTSYGQIIEDTFDMTVAELAGKDDFKLNKRFLNDALLATKIVSAFDKVEIDDLVAMRQSVEFIVDFYEEKINDIRNENLKPYLLRPIKTPQELLPLVVKKATNDKGQANDKEEKELKRIEKLKEEELGLKAVYEKLMEIDTDELELVTLENNSGMTGKKALAQPIDSKTKNNEDLAEKGTNKVLAVSSKAYNKFDNRIKTTLSDLDIGDVTKIPLTKTIEKVKNHWTKVATELAPVTMPQPDKFFQVGINAFLVRPMRQQQVQEINMPDFSTAIFKPIGIGNLQVVKQEVIGYERGEVSHIENVMRGEFYKRTTERTELNETTTVFENETIQAEERDSQSTEKNELASEANRESARQSTNSQGNTISSDYGKLVENNRTNHARSVTERAVNSLTQKVKQQRIQREQKTFREEISHEYDNKEAETHVSAIYQWVDKKYKVKLLNYGKRLLYDLVIPEPAAFLIESLKEAKLMDSFDLRKPAELKFRPEGLNASNYMHFAKLYGVTGIIEPPPIEFITIPNNFTIENYTIEKDGDGFIYKSKNIPIPEGYYAYANNYTSIKREPHPAKPSEFYSRIGYYDPLNVPGFRGEMKEIPLFVTTKNISMITMNIMVVCKRQNSLLQKWQLKTYAALEAGYKRQLAEYEDKLAQYRANIRTQMALARNFTRSSSLEITELKKAFIQLLISERLGNIPTPPSFSSVPDLDRFRKWGEIVAFFERAFEWENLVYHYYPYFWANRAKWGELILIQDLEPKFEAFLKAGAARVVVPVRPGFEAALAHFQETGDVWMGKEMPNMFSEMYVSIIEEIKARNAAPGEETLIEEWEVKLPTSLVMIKEDVTFPVF
jgi:hypothetical protein